MLTVNDRIQVPLSEFDFSFSRSSGPGGQNVNKVNTKVTLRWKVAHSDAISDAVRSRFLERYQRRITRDGDLLITSQRFRDQGRNVADCLSRLRELLLAVAEPPRQRKATRPSRASVRRRLDNKRKQSQKKQRRRRPTSDD